MLVLTCALLRLWLKVLSDSSPPSWRRGDIQAWLQCPLKLPRKSFKKKVISWYFVLYVNFLTFIYSLRGSIRYNLLRIMICLNKGPGLGLQCQSLNNGDFTIRRRDGNENVQNNNRFSRQNNNFARASHFLVHFIAVFGRLRREIA